MSASFTLTAADFVRLQKIVGRRLQREPGLSRVLFFLRVLFCLCFGLALATYVRLLGKYPDAPDLQIVAYLAVSAILVTVAMPHVSHAIMRKHMLAPNSAFLSSQTLRLTDDALTVQSAAVRSEVPWTSVLARDEDDANYYLFIDAMQALVLPRSAVASFANEFERHTAHLKRDA